ncbi:hypothetical protein TDB9533_03090 [Thalassocella blandensis]|nr:hypothetical protein TDB9533_03090 [Thalassocella blandensis]
MSQRVDYTFHAGELFEQYLKLDTLIKSTLPKALSSLVTLRASQLNGCAFCVDMHIKEAKLEGVDGLKIHHVAIWRESPLFDEKEKLALLWTETLTSLDGRGVSDEIYTKMCSMYDEREISCLTFLISVINGWNRLGVAFQSVPGSADKAFGLDKVSFA